MKTGLYTVRIINLDRLNWVKLVYGGLGFFTTQAALKNDACFKSGQKWLKINIVL